MQTKQGRRVNVTSEIHLKHFSCVLHFDLLLSYQRHKDPFKVLKRVSQGAYKSKLVVRFEVNSMFNVGLPKPIYMDQENLDRGKSQ